MPDLSGGPCAGWLCGEIAFSQPQRAMPRWLFPVGSAGPPLPRKSSRPYGLTSSWSICRRSSCSISRQQRAAASSSPARRRHPALHSRNPRTLSTLGLSSPLMPSTSHRSSMDWSSLALVKRRSSVTASFNLSRDEAARVALSPALDHSLELSRPLTIVPQILAMRGTRRGPLSNQRILIPPFRMPDAGCQVDSAAAWRGVLRMAIGQGEIAELIMLCVGICAG